MKDAYQDLRDDQLRRKLNLSLGTPRGFDWLDRYATWCADNAVEVAELYEDRTVKLFVSSQEPIRRKA